MMMIKSLSVLAAMVATANGFSAPVPVSPRRPDATSAVEEALKITASFGIDSNEAKVAWDIVEEMDASDNTEAMKGSLVEECDVPLEEVSTECMDYGRFLDELFVLRDLMPHTPDNKKPTLAQVLKNIKLTPPESAHTESSPQLSQALVDAKAATEEYGITSPEAKLAWETYEDIASTGTQNAVGVNLMEECSIESGQEACQAMEELERVMPVLLALSLNKNKEE